MAWSSGYIVTRAEVIAHSAQFPLVSGQSLSNDAYALTNTEAFNKVCCNCAYISDNLYATKYDDLVQTYSYSFRYSSSSCAGACGASYTTYWSNCSSLNTSGSCELYTDCQCKTMAPAGYYLDSSGNCWHRSIPA